MGLPITVSVYKVISNDDLPTKNPMERSRVICMKNKIRSCQLVKLRLFGWHLSQLIYKVN